MNLSNPFIQRPVATTLLTIGLALAGLFAFFKLPVAPLPQVDFPTISVTAQMPGASPDTMATTVATPLERHLGVIADVTEMTSQSSVGSSRITLQFALGRNIDGAARDVQAAIVAARVDLPASLRTNPTYRKVNPADAPIIVLSLTSDTRTRGQVYDAASTILQPALSQIEGVGQVTIGGAAAPAVRVELNPLALFKYGIGLEDVRAALASANAHSPKGALDEGQRHFQIYTNDQATKPDDYKPLVIAYRNGAAVRLTDIADVEEGQENIRNVGLANGKPAVLVIINQQPGGNIISTIDRIYAVLPQLRASLPSDIDLAVAVDRSTTIRASLQDVEITLVIAIALVILVVFMFLRNGRATLIPSVAVPVSLIGTFGAMYLLGYSLDNLSLMALTISTGFVVDDAIVVLENITRHVEGGMSRREAALLGAREVGFTVLSMSLSLIAVFVPILLMGGLVGRIFREFAMTLSVAILISLVVSLTTTPMMCAYIATHTVRQNRSRWYLLSERAFDAMLRFYDRTLRSALRRPALVMLVLLLTVVFNVYLFIIVPKGLFPQQDTGRMVGGLQADQSISFQLMSQKLRQFVRIVREDPAVESVVGFTGGGQTNSGFMFVALKPLSQRKVSVGEVMGRLRPKLAQVPGARLFLQPVQDIRVGGRQSNALYQYTLQSDDLNELYEWAPKVTAALEKVSDLTEVNSDQQQKGLETDLVIDRPTAARLGLTASQIDNTLYDAFGQRQVSVIYAPRNQYHVVMEVAPQFWQSPDTLDRIFISTAGGTVKGTQSTNFLPGTVAAPTPSTSRTGSTATTSDATVQAARNQATNAIANSGRGATSTGAAVSTVHENMVPLSVVAHYQTGNTPLAVNHQGLFVASTISFNLKPGISLGQATQAINAAVAELRMPATIHGSFSGTAQVFQQSLANEPILIAAALIAVYIVLGVLYESYIHPITILSTLPSAGVGAVLALMLFNTDFSIIALIGVILLIGIVKKNAIMMIDFAIAAERNEGLSSRQAIYKASILRFRPIMMTTMAAALGALPLAIGFGEGSELRRPLGISIVGGLLVSQMLTLYTTPIIYLYLDRFGLWARQRWGIRRRFWPGRVAEPGE
ncbi:MAG: efflux RND transporter permease subunit [Alphaproteobacteria bacterium]|nr:efflux RND transporter permease subunit [Alphaproteobacteria bacterium]MBV9587289.1 efflux RND transporter permease subunit [Alphaproteobacteria bacterium]